MISAWGRGSNILLFLNIVAVLMALAITVNSILSYRNARDVVTANYRQTVATQGLREALIDAETGQRGYLLTGKMTYLAPYHAGIKRANIESATLKRIIPAYDMQPALHSISALTKSRIAVMNETIILARDGKVSEAVEVVRSNRGKRIMDQLRLRLGELERRSEVQMYSAVALATQRERQLITGLTLLVPLIVLLAFLAVHKAAAEARAQVNAFRTREVAEARDRAELLVREINHRVGNLFAVVSAIVRMTGSNERDVPTVIEKIIDRLKALHNSHSITQDMAPGESRDVQGLVETSLSPYISPVRTATIAGAPAGLANSRITSFGMIVHELATNAVKYGAWAEPGGSIDISWNPLEDSDCYELIWQETSDRRIALSDNAGFGTAMQIACARQLGGKIERTAGPQGIIVRLTFKPA